MTVKMTGQRSQALNQRAYRLAQATIGYNLIEGVVMIAAGIAAGLVSVIGFGVDSGIESISAVLVLLRVGARLRDGDLDQAKERRALKLVAVTFFLLAAYVIVEGIADLVRGEVPEPSAVGVVMLAASLIVMPLLAWAKTKVGRELGDNLILADAAETKVCVLMSASTLLGLLAFTWTGATWIDPVAGFVIAVFAIREGTEAWEGELVEDEGEGGES